MIQASALVSREALTRYDSTGDPVYSTPERIVLALRWFEWATGEQLREALEVDDSLERIRVKVALARLVKRGIVEAREGEYRLVISSRALPLRDTPAMRAAVTHR